MSRVIAHVDWQDSSTYLPLLQMDRSLLMWEWLRRDLDYREFYVGRSRDSSRLPSGINLVRLAEDDALQRWGSHFRGIS